DIPFAVGPFLCHGDRLLCSNTTYHRRGKIARSTVQSYQTIYICGQALAKNFLIVNVIAFVVR
ncbi:hypothetical protein, partial [Flavonifractor plautii]|uniref:hypothetical protein n=1 Tax=Flavonifractor plautii TaxID=292800 RepID=UPI00321B7666